jgi:hypothetical protein
VFVLFARAMRLLGVKSVWLWPMRGAQHFFEWRRVAGCRMDGRIAGRAILRPMGMPDARALAIPAIDEALRMPEKLERVRYFVPDAGD